MTDQSITKICSKCKEEKPRDCFSISNRALSGLQSACRSCCSSNNRVPKSYTYKIGKNCSKCGLYREINLFPIDKRSRDFHASQCSHCYKQYLQKRKEENPEKIKLIKKTYRDKNKDKRRDSAKIYRSKHRDSLVIRNREYRKKNPDKVASFPSSDKKKNAERLHRRYLENKPEHAKKSRAWLENNRDAYYAIQRNRKVRKRQADGSHTGEDIKRIYALQSGKCIACLCDLSNVKYHADHRVALINGGSNDWRNIDILCQSCNCSKRSKHPIDFMQSKGWLL